MKHEFRNPDLLQVHPIRNLLRGQHPDYPMPSGPEGLVINDIDLVVKWHGDQFGLIGQRIRFVEMKHGLSCMTGGQMYTYADMDYRHSMLPDGYDGFFQVNYDHTLTVEVDVGNGKVLEFPHPSLTYEVMGASVHEMDTDEFTQWITNPFSPFPGMGETPEFKRLVAKIHGSG
jgi:hypothetical protein